MNWNHETRPDKKGMEFILAYSVDQLGILSGGNHSISRYSQYKYGIDHENSDISLDTMFIPRTQFYINE